MRLTSSHTGAASAVLAGTIITVMSEGRLGGIPAPNQDPAPCHVRDTGSAVQALSN